MAIDFNTTDPNKLLADFKSAIDKGHVVTWSYDSAGDFTHTPEQWLYRGWMRPYIFEGRLSFGFIGSNSYVTTKAIYAVYHGRLFKLLLRTATRFSTMQMPRL